MSIDYRIYWEDTLIASIIGGKYYPYNDAIEKTSILKSLVASKNGLIPRFVQHRIDIDPECKQKSRLITDKLRIEKVV